MLIHVVCKCQTHPIHVLFTPCTHCIHIHTHPKLTLRTSHTTLTPPTHTQYLQLVADFQPADQSILFMVYGATALVVQAVVLPWLLCVTTERRVLCLGMWDVLVCFEMMVVCVCDMSCVYLYAPSPTHTAPTPHPTPTTCTYYHPFSLSFHLPHPTRIPPPPHTHSHLSPTPTPHPQPPHPHTQHTQGS